jgi:hypothetical protein
MTFPFPVFFAGGEIPSFEIADTFVDTVDRTNYSFTTVSLGVEASNRYLLIGVATSSSLNRTISVFQLDATDIELLSNVGILSRSYAWGIIAWPTGTTGDLTINMSAGISRMSGVIIPIYYDSLILLDSVENNANATTMTLANIVQHIGGTIVAGIDNSSNTDTATASWTGADAIADLDNAIVESTQALTVKINTTETTDDDDLTFTSSGTTNKTGAALSFADNYSETGKCLNIWNSGDLGNTSPMTRLGVPLGPKRTGRMIALTIAWDSGTTRTLSSVTIGGNATTIVDQVSGSTGGSAIVRLDNNTMGWGVVVITMSGALAGSGINFSVYNCLPASSTPVDNGSINSTATTVTVADLEVKNGGFALLVAENNNTETVTASYNGSDTPTKDYERIEAAEGFTSWSMLTTENQTTNDWGITTSASVPKRVTAASWL